MGKTENDVRKTTKVHCHNLSLDPAHINCISPVSYLNVQIDGF